MKLFLLNDIVVGTGFTPVQGQEKGQPRATARATAKIAPKVMEIIRA